MLESAEINDAEMVRVIADFLEQGLVGNIVAMFKADTGYYRLIGRVLQDERFAVRLGVAVLFEELIEQRPAEVTLALPALTPLLHDGTPAYVRGEAVNLLGMIGSKKALALIEPLAHDKDPQVAEIVKDFLAR